MMLVDDAAMRPIEPLADRELPKLYDTELMLGGGHIAGSALCELVNLNSPALIFRPVHRVVFGAEIDAPQSGFERYLRARTA